VKTFKATVEIVQQAHDVEEAAMGLSELLSGAQEEHGVIVDWWMGSPLEECVTVEVRGGYADATHVPEGTTLVIIDHDWPLSKIVCVDEEGQATC
jgi:hypothetical protein